MSSLDFVDYALAAPTYEDVAAEYRGFQSALTGAASGVEAIAAVEAWDAARRRLMTWSSLTYIRFTQDTTNAEYKQAREYVDEMQPKLTELDVAVKRLLMASPHRDALAQRYGDHVFDLWACAIAAFDPVIQDDLVEQSKLDLKYTELLASAKFEFQGESLTLSELQKFAEHPDRQVRLDAAILRWEWFGEQQPQLDGIFARLVELRNAMARKLNFENYVPLAYQLMQRIDYGREDVEAFRAQVRDHVVPLATRIRKEQAKKIGVEPLMAWDMGLHDPTGNPRPQGDHDWMIDRATSMFQALGGGMDVFFDKMKDQHLMDLKSRDGKAGGGYCDCLPEFGMPFIFANFNGSKGDVEVFTHEMGHAFQTYMSRQLALSDFFWPTTESCEIHSMGLEFLSWPHMELFFGDDAQRFRRLHLTQSLLFLPYGCAVDHFQHLVYADPAASPDGRAEMWQAMERTYQPTLNWGELRHPASGRRWQAQLHIYGSPFYYVDYALALTCALQLWLLAETNREQAMEAYLGLCRRGGQAPFGELVQAAGLRSPFADGCLAEVVDHAAEHIFAE